MVGEHIWSASTLIAWPERVCELFMNDILYFYELLKISIWQHWEGVGVGGKPEVGYTTQLDCLE